MCAWQTRLRNECTNLLPVLECIMDSTRVDLHLNWRLWNSVKASGDKFRNSFFFAKFCNLSKATPMFLLFNWRKDASTYRTSFRRIHPRNLFLRYRRVRAQCNFHHRTPKIHLGTMARPWSKAASPCVLCSLIYSSSRRLSNRKSASRCRRRGRRGNGWLGDPKTNERGPVKILKAIKDLIVDKRLKSFAGCHKLIKILLKLPKAFEINIQFRIR